MHTTSLIIQTNEQWNLRDLIVYINVNIDEIVRHSFITVNFQHYFIIYVLSRKSLVLLMFVYSIYYICIVKEVIGIVNVCIFDLLYTYCQGSHWYC